MLRFVSLHKLAIVLRSEHCLALGTWHSIIHQIIDGKEFIKKGGVEFRVFNLCLAVLDQSCVCECIEVGMCVCVCVRVSSALLESYNSPPFTLQN